MHASSQKTKLNVLSYGVKIWTDLSSVCHNSLVGQTDGRTDGQTDGQLAHRYTTSAFHAARQKPTHKVTAHNHTRANFILFYAYTTRFGVMDSVERSKRYYCILTVTIANRLAA